MQIKLFVGSIVALATLLLSANFAQSQQKLTHTFPEQRQLCVRSPEQFQSAPIPATGIPFTVSIETDNRTQEKISLDEAILIAIQNADVVRVLSGVSARNSGSTIYDVAISNTEIDSQSSIFDPIFDFDLTWNRAGAGLGANRNDSVDPSVGISKRMLNGATVGVDVDLFADYFEFDRQIPFGNPSYPYRTRIDLTQPLLKGYGRDVNLAPVVVARIDTERSYFRFKDSVQEMVRGVIEAYWNLVASRVAVWAREQQIEQAQFAYDRAVARKAKGLSQLADVAQSRSALANFRASLISARSNLILRETALRSILGLDPSDTSAFVPTSMPLLDQVEFDWNAIVAIAEQYRPDVIELKLILEADRQNLLVADNQAKPRLDGIAGYNWDGVSGELPSGVVTPFQAVRGFNMGVRFSVPLGLRRDRASLRRQELILARDQTNLEQGIFQMVQDLTINYRNLDQFFNEYVAFKEAREAARQNYENQAAEVLAGRREFINALQAITDWGNAVLQEAQSITQYNTELANVERQSGTILETHGIYFTEERYGSLGPKLFGLLRSEECYPERLNPDGGSDNYQESEDTSDDSFNLEDLSPRRESNLRNREPGIPQPTTDGLKPSNEFPLGPIENPGLSTITPPQPQGVNPQLPTIPNPGLPTDVPIGLPVPTINPPTIIPGIQPTNPVPNIKTDRSEIPILKATTEDMSARKRSRLSDLFR